MSNRVMIVFEHDIIVLNSDPKTNKFTQPEEYDKTLNLITYATLNQDE